MIWYSDKLDDVVRELNTDLAQGLSDSEAAVRLQEHGSNRLNEKKPRSFLQRFLDQMKDVMIIILLIAALISLGLSIYNFIQGAEADWIEPIVIVLIVIVNGLLGVIQESKAEAALEALKNMSSPSAKVLRDGEMRSIPSTDLVPGDIVDIEAGDLVPADCRLLSSASFKCDESALTGESVGGAGSRRRGPASGGGSRPGGFAGAGSAQSESGGILPDRGIRPGGKGCRCRDSGHCASR